MKVGDQEKRKDRKTQKSRSGESGGLAQPLEQKTVTQRIGRRRLSSQYIKEKGTGEIVLIIEE